MSRYPPTYGAIGRHRRHGHAAVLYRAHRTGQPVRPQIQSMVVFGIIGLIMIYLGLAALGIVPDPFARMRGAFPTRL